MFKFKLTLIVLLFVCMIAYVVQSFMYQTFNFSMSAMLLAGFTIVCVRVVAPFAKTVRLSRKK